MVNGEAGIYLFCGGNVFLREDAQKKIISKIVPRGADKLDCDIYDANDCNTGFFEMFNTLPFSSGKRVVIIKNIESFPEFKKKAFLTYIKNPPKHICLILQTAKDAFNNNFIKAVSEYAKTYLFKKYTPREIRNWIHGRVREYKKSITKEALDLILEQKGKEGLIVVSGEIEKLVLYKKDKRIINERDVVRLVGKSGVKTAFDLADAVSLKDKERALSLISGLSSGGKNNIPEMVGLMGWQLRKIWKAKSLLLKGEAIAAICSRLKIRSFSIDRFLDQSKRFDMEEIKRGFRLLLEADRSIKSGRNRPDFILEELVIKLCDG